VTIIVTITMSILLQSSISMTSWWRVSLSLLLSSWVSLWQS